MLSSKMDGMNLYQSELCQKKVAKLFAQKKSHFLKHILDSIFDRFIHFLNIFLILSFIPNL